nr:AAA family ATPase [bacterium]
MAEILISSQFTEVLDLLENGSGHVFVTGKAGTGKSTLLQHFRLQTAKPLVVLAPTGVAAVNVAGETIHSFFHFQPNVTIAEARKAAQFAKNKKLYQKLELVIIDEISMVRSDLLDCVDEFLRLVRKNNQAFGGVRMIFFGDLYQLPPVVSKNEYQTFKTLYQSEWFFDATVMH